MNNTRKKGFTALLVALLLVASLTSPLARIDTSEAAAEKTAATWAQLQEEIQAAKTVAVTIKLTSDVVCGYDVEAEEEAKEESGEEAAEGESEGETEGTPIIIRNGNRITIDLCGFTLDRGLGGQNPVADGYAICIEEGGTLTLTDSTDKAGTITGAANDGDGGAIRCDKNAKLTVENGVNITGNRAKRGGGIFLTEGDEVSIGSCTITENQATENGGGIYGGGGAILQLAGGLTRIRDNTRAKTDNDLYITNDMDNIRFWCIPDPKKTKKEISKEFTDGTRIGILLEEIRKEITDGYGKVNSDEGSLYFFYNNEEEYRISSKNTSEVSLEKIGYKVNDKTTTTLEVFDDKGKRKSAKEYSSFTEALKAGLSVTGNRVVTLGGDFETADPIKITADITVDLNGHYIKRTTEDDETEKDGSVFIVKEACTLGIADSNPKRKSFEGIKGGVITGGASSNGGGGITVEEKGHLVMSGGTIYNCFSDEDGGAVYLTKGSSSTTFTATGGKIASCRTVDSTDECFGGGIYLGEGTVDLKNFTFEDCYSEDDGGAIYSRCGELVLNEVTFSSNKAHERGGAIYVDYGHGGTKITARNCDFVRNEAVEDGGALCLRNNPENDGSMMFDRCEFFKNKAGEDGGAIVQLDDGLVLSNVKITENEAGELGGGVYVDGRYDINVRGVVVIKDNVSKERDDCSDLCLDFGTFVDAHIYSGGLSQGSWIGIGMKTDKSVMLSDTMSEYEMKFFHTKTGSIGGKKLEAVEVAIAITASIFGTGQWIAIAVIGGAGLVLLIVLIIWKRRKPAQV